jgi:hypothetical protein
MGDCRAAETYEDAVGGAEFSYQGLGDMDGLEQTRLHGR